VTDLVVERARFDRELLNALPKSLSKAIERLAFRGNLGAQGALAFRGAAGQPTSVSWDLNLDLENVSLDCGCALGASARRGTSGGQKHGCGFLSRGELNIDSLIHQDIQLTQIRGPLLIEPERVVLGDRGRT
jgi:hypothetical protein